MLPLMKKFLPDNELDLKVCFGGGGGGGGY